MAVPIPTTARNKQEELFWDTGSLTGLFEVPKMPTAGDIEVFPSGAFELSMMPTAGDIEVFPSGAFELSMMPTAGDLEVIDVLMESTRKTISVLTESLSVTRPLAARDLVREYLNLGRVEGREGRKEFWQRHVDLGARVLLARARYDTDVERLSEVSGLLAEITGPRLILDALSEDTPARSEYYESLLRAIRWTTSPLESEEEKALLVVLRHLVDSESADMREAAYMAAIRLPRAVALEFLDDSLKHEEDQEARRVINETVEELGD